MSSATSDRFRPHFWGTIGLIVGCSIFITAGFWQLDRADQKRSLFAAFEQSGDVEVLQDPVTDRDAGQFLYRRISLTGHYDPEHQILLDNMIHNGRPGYQVLTPLRIGATAVLVNRGWLRADPDRRTMPDVNVTEQLRDVTGRLYRLPRAGYKLEPAVTKPGHAWPRRLSYPSIEEIIDQVGYPIHDYQLLLDPAATDGYLREWRPALMPPEKHVAYAIQWFLMAGAISFIYVTLTIKAARRTTLNA